MDPKLQRRVQRYGWDKASATYERYWQAQLSPAQDRVIERAGLREGEAVLDVACGTGLVTFRAAAVVGPTGSVSAVDLSDAMVECVARESAARGLKNVTAQRMGAESLEFPDGMFDAALCALGLMYVPDPLAAAKELLRVLKTEGRAVAAVWGARDRCGWAEIFPIVDSRVESDVCPMFFQLGTGDRLRVLLEAAGFRDVKTERVSSVLTYASGEEACGAAFEGGPVALAYSRFDEATRSGARAEYLASIARWGSGGGYEVPGEFVIASGVR